MRIEELQLSLRYADIGIGSGTVTSLESKLMMGQDGINVFEN
jgi:hypothetical protein